MKGVIEPYRDCRSRAIEYLVAFGVIVMRGEASVGVGVEVYQSRNESFEPDLLADFERERLESGGKDGLCHFARRGLHRKYIGK